MRTNTGRNRRAQRKVDDPLGRAGDPGGNRLHSKMISLGCSSGCGRAIVRGSVGCSRTSRLSRSTPRWVSLDSSSLFRRSLRRAYQLPLVPLVADRAEFAASKLPPGFPGRLSVGPTRGRGDNGGNGDTRALVVFSIVARSGRVSLTSRMGDVFVSPLGTVADGAGAAARNVPFVGNTSSRPPRRTHSTHCTCKVERLANP